VATILGDHNINIAGFGLSRNKNITASAAAGENVADEMAFVSVDSPIPDDVLGEIRAIDGMIEAVVIRL
jgi:D-3-phosphoglycerate dehydrogenase